MIQRGGAVVARMLDNVQQATIRPLIERFSDFRWHDLRHTWASWHVQAGTPLNVLKKLGGWASLDMVLRYAHLGADHLAEHAEPIGGLRLVRTNPGTAKKTPCRKLR